MATKTDNHDPRAKLELRRYMLRKYHADGPIDVLDCCQGGGVLWEKLRQEFSVTSYWGVDVKPKKGRLKLDSVRILQQAGWPQNVVDVDTYGSPFRHWLAMLPNVSRPTTVFLTHAQVQIGGSPLIKEARGALELKDLDIPNAIAASLNKLALSYVLATGCGSAIITEAVEAVSGGNARYIGVRLDPIPKTNGRGTGIPGRSEHEQPQEVAHV